MILGLTIARLVEIVFSLKSDLNSSLYVGIVEESFV